MDGKKIKIVKSNKIVTKVPKMLSEIERTQKSKKSFPYLESFDTPKSSKNPYSNNPIISPNFIYTDTLNFSKPSFSFKNIFKKIKVSSDSPIHFNKSLKVIASQNKSITNTLNYNPAKNLQPDFKSVIRVKSQNKKSIRFLKLQPLARNFNNKINPEGLRINRLSCVSRQDRLNSENFEKKLNRTPEKLKNNDFDDKDYQDSLRVKFDLISEYLK